MFVILARTPPRGRQRKTDRLVAAPQWHLRALLVSNGHRVHLASVPTGFSEREMEQFVAACDAKLTTLGVEAADRTRLLGRLRTRVQRFMSNNQHHSPSQVRPAAMKEKQP